MNMGTAGVGPEAAGSAWSNVGFLNRAGLWKMVLGNILLTTVTLGIYRFWARTRIRRYFWSNITILGEPLEYSGTGRELFVGFLIVVAVLAPLAVAYYVLQRILLGNPVAISILLLGYVAVLFVLIHFAVYRARRYRLTRTMWRGIRAGQTGSTWRYVGLAALYTVMSVITLGLASPWMEVGLERHKMNNTWFGNSRFRLEASGSKLFLRMLVVYTLYLLPVVVIYAANWSWLVGHFLVAGNVRTGVGPGLPPHPEAFLLLLVMIFAGIPAVVWYGVAKFRYFANSTSLGEIRLKSEVTTGPVVGYLIGYVLSVIGLLILSGIIAFIVAGVVSPSSLADISPQTDPLAAAAAFGPIYALVGVIVIVFYFPARSLLFYCWLQVSLVRHFATTMTIENAGEFSRIAQSTRQDPRFAEGLADAFDVGIGVG